MFCLDGREELLLRANCDEFIFYDDLVQEQEAKRKRREKQAVKSVAGTGKPSAAKQEDSQRQQALDLLIETRDEVATPATSTAQKPAN